MIKLEMTVRGTIGHRMGDGVTTSDLAAGVVTTLHARVAMATDEATEARTVAGEMTGAAMTEEMTGAVVGEGTTGAETTEGTTGAEMTEGTTAVGMTGAVTIGTETTGVVTGGSTSGLMIAEKGVVAMEATMKDMEAATAVMGVPVDRIGVQIWAVTIAKETIGIGAIDATIDGAGIGGTSVGRSVSQTTCSALRTSTHISRRQFFSKLSPPWHRRVPLRLSSLNGMEGKSQLAVPQWSLRRGRSVPTSGSSVHALKLL
jgi:hypothetical protein